MKGLVTLLVTAALLYLLSGFHVVGPDEQAVVRRFGRAAAPLREPGPHLGLPRGLDRVDRLKPREKKRIDVGLPDATDGTLGTGASQFLTGDRNLVNLQASVQYTVKEPAKYLFGTSSVDGLIAVSAEVTLTELLAVEPVDRVLTEGKRQLANRAVERLQAVVDDYGLGVDINSVDIGSVEPPAEVADSFDAVISALRQREQLVNEAAADASEILAAARTEETQEVDQAVAHRDGVVEAARGDAARFASLLAEYRRAPRLTATRLYLETISEILPRLRSKIIVDPGSHVDLSIVPDDDVGEGSRDEER